MKGVNIDLTKKEWRVCMEYLMIDEDKNTEIIKKFETYAVFRHWLSEVREFMPETPIEV